MKAKWVEVRVSHNSTYWSLDCSGYSMSVHHCTGGHRYDDHYCIGGKGDDVDNEYRTLAAAKRAAKKMLLAHAWEKFDHWQSVLDAAGHVVDPEDAS